ncbi:MAG: DUF5723 family protein [Bacteroidia bacterium]
MKKILLFIFVTIGISFSGFAQDFLGYSNSNYSGVTGTDLQPAAVVDSRYKTDINLVGFNLNITNNYAGIKKSAFEHTGGLFSGVYPAFQDTIFSQHYIGVRDNRDDKRLSITNQLYLPSFLVSIDEKNAIAFKFRVRTIANVDGVSNELATLFTNQLDYPSLLKTKLNNKNLDVQTMSWVDYSLTYGHVFKKEGAHFLKAGVTLKVIQGLQALYMHINELNYEFTTDTTLSLFNTNVNYGHSNYFPNKNGNVKNVSSPFLGFDFGVVYEWRPDFEKYKYEMDGKTDLYRNDKNKYKLRVGISLVDVGKAKFIKAANSNDFTANIKFMDLKSFSNATLEDFDDSLRKKFIMHDDGKKFFKMNLPTALSAQIDYNIYKDFYINFTPYLAFQFKNNKVRIHEITAYSITPRWDHKWFGVFMPLSVDQMQNKKLGLGLRVGPVIVGTNSINPFITKKDIYSANIYFMLKIPILYGSPKDRDKDKVSDKLDACIDVPGVWEFKGCPDRDGDHVQDSEDKCPDELGTKALNGCPDKDGDGIADKDDDCPNDSGLPEFKGCPDRDGDKVIDKYDKCPDDPGSVELNGCPDKDGDGVIDLIDKCPEKAGPASNNGCPETKLSLIDLQGNILTTVIKNEEGSFNFTELPANELVIFKLEGEGSDTINEIKAVVNGIPKKAIRGDKDRYFRFIILKTDKDRLKQKDEDDVAVRLSLEEEAIMKKAFENLEFSTASGIIESSSFASLDQLGKLLIKNSKWRLKISGHTDNEGEEATNKKLSQKRAESVKKYLEKKGIAPNRFKTEWFGSKKPISDNNTEEGRQKNRRVELLLIE